MFGMIEAGERHRLGAKPSQNLGIPEIGVEAP